ncbi:MAG: response regulator transcription factor [Lachnospiraceae bacterium]|nr:response regulator transcription factor [Lachnospiraceae bacterium]
MNRVLIVDDHAMLRIVFEEIIRKSQNYTLAGSLDLASSAVNFVKIHVVDLILMDIVMSSGINGLEAARQIKKEHPKIKIILVTSMHDVTFLERAKENGVESFWYKEMPERPLLEVMDLTMKGESVYPLKMPDVKIGNIPAADLTTREKEVLRELTAGMTNLEIAKKLGVSIPAVKSHITNMLQKTGFHSRLELAVHAIIDGIIIHD